MAGLSVPYLFPFCVTPGEEWDGSTFFGSLPSNQDDEYTNVVGPGTKNPIGFTLDQMMEAYYRVKEIEFEYDIVVVEEQPDPDPPVEIPYDGTVSEIRMSGDYENEEGITGYIGISSEADFTCARQTFITLNNSTLNGVGATLQMFIPNDAGAICLESGGLYYPTILLSFTAVDENLTSYQIEGSHERQATAEPDFFGETLNLFGGESLNMTGTMAWTKTEFWPYDPGDGAIWDSSSGSQLRDPFSVQSW